jgi:hypothetical protein
MDPVMIFAFQTVFLVLLFVSMAFRMKGNYLVHGIIIIVGVAIGWLSVIMSLPSFMDSSYMQTVTNPSSTLAVFSSHISFGVATLLSGTWLVALWRPRSTEFAAKSKRIWQLTAILWVATYLLGVLVFVVLHTTFFA